MDYVSGTFRAHPLEEVRHGQIRAWGEEARRIRDATAQERDVEERIGPHGQEPQAGDRDRVERGTRERREGAGPPFVIEEALTSFVAARSPLL